MPMATEASSSTTRTIPIRTRRRCNASPCNSPGPRSRAQHDKPVTEAMNLTVCLLASEAAPFSKTGGLADVSGALTKYLHATGHDVRLFTPLYSSIDRSSFPLTPVRGLETLTVSVGSHRYTMSVWNARMPNSTADVYLID